MMMGFFPASSPPEVAVLFFSFEDTAFLFLN
jgi:hypothetical protein